MSTDTNSCNTKNRGRPPVQGRQVVISLRLRTGRSDEEDSLIGRLEELGERGQRSRVIRRVLITGDVAPILEQEMQRESELVQARFAEMVDMWSDDEDEERPEAA